jgi:CobQ-like glutamine amidotransferase family enzyme
VPDQTQVSRSIDALVTVPSTDQQRYQAALTVCATLQHVGNTNEQIREVLDCLDLLTVTASDDTTRRVGLAPSR